MAVERIKEFTIDLGDLVKTRLDSFVKSRNKAHAVEEATFQRSVVDNDLSYQEQLDYRKAQLEIEETKIYPDLEFIEEVKTSVSALKKMVRHRKFRDAYFTFLQDLASGKRALEDHLEFLKDSLADETLDREIKDELKDQYVKTVEAKRTQDRQIIDAQITFNQKDKTAESIDKAMNLVKSQLTKPDIQKDEALRISYELQLETLGKEKMEVSIEDKMNWMAINLISRDRKNPSLWKLETFSGFRDKSGITMPVNIGGVRYASEQEYWQITLNNYVQNDFGNEYVAENKGEAALIWNKWGLLPDTYIKNLTTNNNIIRTHPELENFQRVIASAIQDSITNTLALKAKDLTAKYYLDKPDIATESDYQKAKQELENLKVIFGEDYSLSPDIQAVETKLIAKRIRTTGDILKVVGDVMADPEAYGESLDITWEEAFKKYGPGAAVEVQAEVFKKKKPIEVAEETVAQQAQASIKSKVLSYQAGFANQPEGFRERLIEELKVKYPGSESFIADTVYKELRSPERGEPAYVAPTPAPALKPTPTPTPAPPPSPLKPAPAPAPEKPKLGKKVAGFPTTQVQMTEWQQKYIWDAPTKAWYEKP